VRGCHNDAARSDAVEYTPVPRWPDAAISAVRLRPSENFMTSPLSKLCRLPLGVAAFLCAYGASIAGADQVPPLRARQVVDLALPGDSNPRELTAFDSALFFVADSTFFGPSSLWRTDATFEGTRHVRSFPGDPPIVRNLKAWDGALYFAATDVNAGLELWRSDGTTQGTSLLFDIQIGGGSGDPQQLTASGRYLYFTADDGFQGRELWRTDGTIMGTQIVKDVNFGAGSDPHDLVDFGGVLLFVANDGVHGDELWRTDGTEPGTYMLADVRPGAAGADIREITVAGAGAWFAADNGIGGSEIWFTDGTLFFTLPLNPEIRPGPASSSPSGLTNLRGELFFAADDGVHGRELWKLDRDSGPTMVFHNQTGPDSLNPSQLRAVEGVRE